MRATGAVNSHQRLKGCFVRDCATMGGKASAHAGDLLPATGQTTNVSHLFATVDVLLVKEADPKPTL